MKGIIILVMKNNEIKTTKMNRLLIKLLLKCSLLLSFVCLAEEVSAQSYNDEKVALTNFLVRMYKNAPFEGVRVVNDYNNNYLLSVLTLDKAKYPNQSVLNRVAGVKAMSQASRFFNGSNITSELIIYTSETPNKEGEAEVIETIRENSVGYVKALEQLTNFEGKDGRQVFIYYKQINTNSKDNTEE